MQARYEQILAAGRGDNRIEIYVNGGTGERAQQVDSIDADCPNEENDGLIYLRNTSFGLFVCDLSGTLEHRLLQYWGENADTQDTSGWLVIDYLSL